MAKKHMSNDEKRELAWDQARVRNKEEIAKIVAFLKLDMNTFEIEYSTKCKMMMLSDYFSHDLKSLVKRSKSHSEELKA